MLFRSKPLGSIIPDATYVPYTKVPFFEDLMQLQGTDINADSGKEQKASRDVLFSQQPNFTLVGVSKRLDVLARAAVIEAVRLDAEEAPQREIESQRKQAEDSRAQQEKARLANKPTFRP